MRISRWIMVAMLAAVAAGCATTQKHGDAAREKIITQLSAKVQSIDGYVQDYVMGGMRIKRMYFQFEKQGRPFYRFREDLIRDGKPYVYIYNADGKYDFHYFPDDRAACRCPTSGAWNPSNYEKARQWHFGYEDARIEGEMVVAGRPCYLLFMRGSVYAVSMETGMPLAKMNREKDLERAVTYENMTVDLDEGVFDLPPGVRVVDREDCDGVNGRACSP